MRLRQVVIAARDLDATVDHLTAILGIAVAFRDPGVAEFGLVNAVMPIGDTFLEVVSPVVPTAPAQRFLDRRGGDGPYMVMLQTDRLDADRARIAALGIRVAWQLDLDDIRDTHLHPADVGGAILALDDAQPPASWRWGGPDWARHVRTDVARTVTGVELTAPDPGPLAERWGRILDLPVGRHGAGRRTIALAPGHLGFSAGDGPRISAYEIAVADPARVRAAAIARGLPVHDGGVTVAGTRLVLVAP